MRSSEGVVTLKWSEIGHVYGNREKEREREVGSWLPPDEHTLAENRSPKLSFSFLP